MDNHELFEIFAIAMDMNSESASNNMHAAGILTSAQDFSMPSSTMSSLAMPSLALLRPSYSVHPRQRVLVYILPVFPPKVKFVTGYAARASHATLRSLEAGLAQKA